MNITQDNSVPHQRELVTIDEVQGFPPLLKFSNKRIPAIFGDAEEDEKQQFEFVCMLFCIMIAFFFMAALFERYKPRCGHQTSFTIIIGIVLSLILYWILGDER